MRKTNIKLGLLLMLFVYFGFNTQAQVIFQEDFENGMGSFAGAAGNTDVFAIQDTIVQNGDSAVYVQYTSNAKDTLYQTVSMDFTTYQHPILNFWHIAKTEGGFDYAYVKISTDDGATWNTLPSNTYMGAANYNGSFNEDSYSEWGDSGNDIPNNTWWKKETFDLTDYVSSSTVKIMFLLTSDGSVERTGWYIDNIVIENVSCLPPTGLSAFDLQLTSAQIKWQSDASEWDLMFGRSGFDTTGMAPTVSGLTNDTLLIDTLTDNTSYDFYVRANCSATDQSEWAGPYTFTTASYGDNCASAISIDIPSALPYTDTSQTTAGRGNNVDTTCLGDYDGGEDIFYKLTVSSEIVINITLNPNSTDYTGILISNACPGSNCIATSTNSNATVHGMNQVHLTPGTYYIMVDTWPSPNNIADFDLTIEEVSCPNPFDLSADNLSYNTVDLTWSSVNASDFDILFDTAGFDTTGIAAINVSASPLHIDTLTENTSYDFYIRANCSATDHSEWVGPFTFTTPLACPAPTNLSAVNITDNSATLVWQSGGASDYVLAYGPYGFDLNTATTIALTDTFYNISGLSAAADYEFYVKDSCSTTEVSPWTGPFSFSTLCSGDLTLPLVENFESGLGIFKNNNGNTELWITQNSIFKEGSNAAYIGYGIYNKDSLVFKCNLDLTGQGNPKLNYWQIAKTEGGYDKCYVKISLDGGNTYTALPDSLYEGEGTYNGYFHEDSYADWGTGAETPDNTWWKSEVFSLAPYADSTNIKILFLLTSDGSAQRDGWYIDRFQIYNETCPPPSNASTINITQNEATATWQSGGSTNYNFVYGPQGFNPNDSTAIALTDTFYTMTGLTPSTSYDYYIQDSCGVGDVSIWIGPFNFFTECAPVTTFPWTEDFENGNVDNCWNLINSADGDSWQFDIPGNGSNPVQYGATQDHTTGSGYVAWVDDSETPIANPVIMETPQFDLSSLTVPRLTYWYWIGNLSPSSSLVVDIFDGTNWIENVDSVGSNGQWERRIIDLSAYTGQTIKVRFKAYEYSASYEYKSDIALDDITVEETPTTPIKEFNGPQEWIAGPIAVGNTQNSGNLFTLLNIGGDTLTITSLTDLSTTEFSSTLTDTLRLAANESYQFGFNYSPVDNVNDSIAFIIGTNGGDADTIILKGSAYELPPCIVEIAGGSETEQHLPMEPFYGYSYSQSIYLQSEINHAQLINKIYYYYNGNSTWTDSIDIYLAHTSQTELTDWIDISNFTRVYQGNFTAPDSASWVEIVLDQPFFYNNTDNLVVAFEESTSGYHSSSDEFYCFNTNSNRSYYHYEDSNNADPTNPPSGSTSTYVPNIRFCMEDGVVDLAIAYPAGDTYNCDYTGNDSVVIGVTNAGSVMIASGDTIQASYDIDGNTSTENFVLQNNLMPNDTVEFTFAQTTDLAGNTTHNYTFTISYAGDSDANNNTSTGSITHYTPAVSINQGDTLVISDSDFPVILTASGVWDSKFWYNADSSQTATSAIFPVNDYGWYYITAVDSNGCEAHDSILIVNVTSIAKLNGVSVSIYPNPNNGAFTVNAALNTNQDVRLSLIDINGKVIFNKNYKNTSIIREQFNIDELANGVYYIKIESNKFVKQTKLVKY